ncbi:hypothetical protein NHX12_022185, partial [Muraenolepis orangiensis]
VLLWRLTFDRLHPSKRPGILHAAVPRLHLHPPLLLPPHHLSLAPYPHLLPSFPHHLLPMALSPPPALPT